MHALRGGGRKKPTSNQFCNFDMNYTMFQNKIRVVVPAVKNRALPKRVYKCRVPKNVLHDEQTDSIEIRWSKLPRDTHSIEVSIEDSTCTYGCNKKCKFIHWKAKFPYADDGVYQEHFIIRKNKRTGIKKNSAREIKKYIRKNDANMNTYIPFCAPPNQKNDCVVHLVVFDKKNKAVAKAMSDPFII